MTQIETSQFNSCLTIAFTNNSNNPPSLSIWVCATQKAFDESLVKLAAMGDRKTRFNIEVRSAAGKWVYVCWVEAKTTREALKTARGLHEVFSTPGRVARATPAK